MRILLVAFEVDSFAIGSIARRLDDRGHMTFLVNGDHWSFIHDRTIRDFYNSLSLTRTYNLEEEYRRFQSKSFHIPDYEYLADFERNNCIDKNLIQLMMSDHILNSWPRYPYYTKFSKEMAYCWTEARLKWLERIFDDTKPEYVFTYDNNYFVKNAVWQIAKSRNIRMKTLIRSRIGRYSYFSENFGYGSEPDIGRLAKTSADERATAFIQSYKQSSTRFSSYDESYTEQFQSQLSTPNILAETGRSLKRAFSRKVVHRSSKRYRGRQPNLMDSNENWPTLFGYMFRVSLNRIRYVWNLKLPFSKTIPHETFVYFPLHKRPESSTLTLSTDYEEADFIRFLSKELPPGLVLVVKENPTMIGERPYDWYRQFDPLLNVILLDPAVRSRSVLERCVGVAGISGTVLFEAALLGKPTLAFGFPEFQSCVDYCGYRGAKEFLQACASREPSRSGDRVLRYVAHVMSRGFVMGRLRRPSDDAFERDVEAIAEYVCSDCNLQNATARAV